MGTDRNWQQGERFRENRVCPGVSETFLGPQWREGGRERPTERYAVGERTALDQLREIHMEGGFNSTSHWGMRLSRCRVAFRVIGSGSDTK